MALLGAAYAPVLASRGSGFSKATCGPKHRAVPLCPCTKGRSRRTVGPDQFRAPVHPLVRWQQGGAARQHIPHIVVVRYDQPGPEPRAHHLHLCVAQHVLRSVDRRQQCHIDVADPVPDTLRRVGPVVAPVQNAQPRHLDQQDQPGQRDDAERRPGAGPGRGWINGANSHTGATADFGFGARARRNPGPRAGEGGRCMNRIGVQGTRAPIHGSGFGQADTIPACVNRPSIEPQYRPPSGPAGPVQSRLPPPNQLRRTGSLARPPSCQQRRVADGAQLARDTPAHQWSGE